MEYIANKDADIKKHKPKHEYVFPNNCLNWLWSGGARYINTSLRTFGFRRMLASYSTSCRCLNQSWLNLNSTITANFSSTGNRNISIWFSENVYKTVIYQIPAMLFKYQYFELWKLPFWLEHQNNHTFCSILISLYIEVISTMYTDRLLVINWRLIPIVIQKKGNLYFFQFVYRCLMIAWQVGR